MIPGEELLFCALGGSGEIGMNVNLYGCDGKWIMVDLGMTFADPAYPGVELILPDLSFIEAAYAYPGREWCSCASSSWRTPSRWPVSSAEASRRRATP